MSDVAHIYSAARRLDAYTDLRTLLLWSIDAATADLVRSFGVKKRRKVR